MMQKTIFLFSLLMITIGFSASGQSFLQFNYGASIPSGTFGEDTELLSSGHAQTGLGLQSEWYHMVFKPVGLGLHYSFSFNNADFLRTGYRYAETYSNIVAGKYTMHDVAALCLVKAYSSDLIMTNIRFTGGTSFISYPEVRKRFYENDVLINEEVLLGKEYRQKFIYGMGIGFRYAVSYQTGITVTVDYQNRLGGNSAQELAGRDYNIEQIFVLLGIDFQLGKK
jgi:opacity protein-like surface antigen